MSQSNKNELVRQAVEPGPVSGNFYILVTNVSCKPMILT